MITLFMVCVSLYMLIELAERHTFKKQIEMLNAELNRYKESLFTACADVRVLLKEIDRLEARLK